MPRGGDPEPTSLPAVWLRAFAGVRVVQNEVLQRCVIPAKAGIQSPGTRGQVWMPAFAGMTLTFLSHPLILNDSRD